MLPCAPRGIEIIQIPNKSPLLKGEHMIFEVESPDYLSYFMSRYPQADGSAAHLLRPNGSSMICRTPKCV